MALDRLFSKSNKEGAMKPRMLAAVLMTSAAVVLLSAQQAPDTLAAQVPRIEGPQSPSRQGFDPYTIPEMMKRFHVPGVSIAVVRDFQVQWTKSYGVGDVTTNAPVTPETLFQAASISKPVTAFAVLRAVDAGKLSLDENVNHYLKNWKVPENQYTRAGVTLRALLSLTSGTGDGFGFPGYSPSAKLPTLEQILDGKPPSNVGAVFWERPPFAAQKYSGGGIEIVQMVLEDVYGKPFAEIMQQQVLDPVGMTNSTYQQPPPVVADQSAARAHDKDGKAMNAK
jgi:CubicO group peptidase (beta-lactamase class C family)